MVRLNAKMAPKYYKPESWNTSTKLKGKEKNVKMCMKADKRDITLLILLLRQRITPPVPYLIITEIILSMSPDLYQDLYNKNCRWKALSEEKQYHWFAWWCKEMEKKEIMKGGGRWVAAVNWENGRIKEVCNCLRDHLQDRGPVFKLVDQEGVNKLKMQVGQKKEFLRQKRQFEAQILELNKVLKEKERFIKAEEEQSILQEYWYRNNDWRYGSVPDLTILNPKTVIGQGYPYGDFLRPVDENALSWNSRFETASTISASSTQHSSSTSLTSWSSSSTATSSTMPIRFIQEDSIVFKTHALQKAMRDSWLMRNKLEKMDMEEKRGKSVGWKAINASVKVC